MSSLGYRAERAYLPCFSDQAHDGRDSHVRYEPLISYYFSGGTIIAGTDATWGLLRGIKQRYRPICGLTSHPLLLLCVAVACCMKPVCVPVPSRVVTNRYNSRGVEASIISGSPK